MPVPSSLRTSSSLAASAIALSWSPLGFPFKSTFLRLGQTYRIILYRPLSFTVRLDLIAVRLRPLISLLSEMKSSQGFVTTDTMSHPDIDNKLRTL